MSAYTYTRSATSARELASGHLGNGTADPRADFRGGRCISDQVNATGVLTGPTSSEPGQDSTARQLKLLANSAVSPVLYGDLRELAKAQLRRECRRWGFDWDAFVADGPEWGVVEVVHRRAVQQGRERGLDLRPTDIPTDTVLVAVRVVLAEWTSEPELRPTYEDFCQEQARRGEKGRETQQAQVAARNAGILALAAEGVSDADIASRVGLNRSQVWRIRKAAAAAVEEQPVQALSPMFPAPEIPQSEHWPAVQFMQQTGVVLDAGQVRWLCDMGRCYEAEGRVDELMAAIRASASEGVRDTWAYLQRCVSNRGDAWTVSAQLLADVLIWAGQKSLEYALTAISGGYVRRPLAYLRVVLSDAVSSGRRPTGWPERPVAVAVGMAKQWAPELVVIAADEAVASEEVDQRTGHLDSYRRRFCRLPWEPELAVDTDGDVGPDCCIGLRRVRGDESNLLVISSSNLESSSGTSKADATALAAVGLERVVSPSGSLGASEGLVSSRPASRPERLEQTPKAADLGDSGGIRCRQSHGEALKSVEAACRPLPRGNRTGDLEQGRCGHPLASQLVSRMDLEAVVEVDCAAGCGHRLYSDRGPVRCPCCWPPAVVAQVARALQQRR